MTDQNRIKEAYQRNKKLLTLKPSKGQYSTTTKVRLLEGTSCEVEHAPWKFTADIGENEGGNDAGPGPSVLERAALGSCLAIGYAKYAAVMDVPLNSLEVEVEAEVDARGAFGIGDVSPGYKGLRYRVFIDSPAPESEIKKLIEKADSHSPVLRNFTQSNEIDREINILKRENNKLVTEKQ
jgi:uncharacterized OsmC-like protein